MMILGLTVVGHVEKLTGLELGKERLHRPILKSQVHFKSDPHAEDRVNFPAGRNVGINEAH